EPLDARRRSAGEGVVHHLGRRQLGGDGLVLRLGRPPSSLEEPLAAAAVAVAPAVLFGRCRPLAPPALQRALPPSLRAVEGTLVGRFLLGLLVALLADPEGPRDLGRPLVGIARFPAPPGSRGFLVVVRFLVLVVRFLVLVVRFLVLVVRVPPLVFVEILAL